MNKQDMYDVRAACRGAIKDIIEDDELLVLLKRRRMREVKMDNLSKLIQATEKKYRMKVGGENLPMEQVAHLVGHLVFEVLSDEIENHVKITEALNGRR